MRNILDKNCRDNQNTRFIFRSIFFSEIRAFMRYSKHYSFSTGTLELTAMLRYTYTAYPF